VKLCIGLFGTCGKSSWRQRCIERYEQRDITFFNPQVEDWDPSLAEVEAAHLAEDSIILFPVTGETYGLGSIAETGFSIAQALKLDDRRSFVIMVDQQLDAVLMEDKTLAQESLRGRALIKQHLLYLALPNVYVVKDLEELLAVSLELWSAHQHLAPLRHLNVARNQ